MATGLRMTEDELRAYRERQQSHSDAVNSSSSSDVESGVVDEPEATHAVQAAVQRVDIRFCHYRRRLADPDNFATKHFVDGLVEAAVLPDDSPKFVNEVRHRQVKIPNWQEEHIEIEIRPIAI